jgi:hypothetical protein
MAQPPKGRADYLNLGDYNTVCFECGRKRKASTLKRHWQGYYVCPEHWEPRHPQDFVRGLPDIQTPPWAQPMPADQFVLTCTLEGVSAIPELAMPGCMIPGRPFTGSFPYSFCPIGSVASRADVAAADCWTVGVF